MEEKRYSLVTQLCSSVAAQLRDIAMLIGEITDTWVTLETGATVMPGLGLIQEAADLINYARYLQQNICHIHVVGTCKAGKSTLINALLGDHLLPTASHPLTGVVTHVVYGPHKRAMIYEDGHSQLSTIEWSAFTHDYVLPRDLQGIIDPDGHIESPLKHIKYAIVESPHSLLEYGIRLIDTPGLNVRLKRPIITPYMLKQQDTLIIVVLNAMLPFSDDIKALLTTLLPASPRKNIFFVVNRIDQLAPTKINEVKQLVQRTLQAHFNDQHHSFDRQLYQQRVFFVSADATLQVRTGSANEQLHVQAAGITALESAIERYLSTTDTLVQFLAPTLRALENMLEHVYAHIGRQRTILAEAEHERSGHFSTLREINRLETLEHLLHQLVRNARTTMTIPTATGETIRIAVEKLPHLSTIPPINTKWEEHLTFAMQVIERSSLMDAASAELYKLIESIIYQHLNPHFSVPVVGEFNSGKSTFINALLRQDLLKTSALVATAITTQIRYASIPDVTVQFNDFNVPLTYTQEAKRLQRFIHLFTQQNMQDDDTVRAYLHKLGANDRIATQIEKLVLSHPSHLLSKGLEIVDTPGLNAVNPQHAKITSTFIEQKADMVIVLIPAPFPLSAVLRDFLCEELFPLQKKCLFLLTQMDKIQEVEQQKLVATHTLQRLMALPGISQPVFLDEIAARVVLENIHKNKPIEQKHQHWHDQFTKLEDKLWDYLHSEHAKTQQQQQNERLRHLYWLLDKHLYASSLNENTVSPTDLQEVAERLLTM